MRVDRLAVIGAAGFAVCVALAGCGTTGSSRSDDSNTLTAERDMSDVDVSSRTAWARMEDKSSKNNALSKIFEIGTGHRMELDKANDAYRAEADRAMNSRLPSDALDEMIDALAQQLARDLPNQPEVRASQYQLVLAVGEFESTDQGENPSLRRVLRGIEQRLSKHPTMKENFRFITVDSSADDVLGQISGRLDDFNDPLGEGASTTAARRYDPAYVYLLTGLFDRTEDPARHTIDMILGVDLTHPLSRRTVDSFEYTSKFYYQPYAKAWLSKTEEDRRRSLEAAPRALKGTER